MLWPHYLWWCICFNSMHYFFHLCIPYTGINITTLRINYFLYKTGDLKSGHRDLEFGTPQRTMALIFALLQSFQFDAMRFCFCASIPWVSTSRNQVYILRSSILYPTMSQSTNILMVFILTISAFSFHVFIFNAAICNFCSIL